MQKLQFNIISRDDWAQLANKQFGYFYFVVDDPTVLNEGGDFYLGENLIGSGMTIEEIVEYFENPANEHTFPGLTVGDLLPRGETAIEVTDRLGIHAMSEKRYFSGEEGKLKRISGVTLDYNNPSTTLKCGLNTGSFQSWTGSHIGNIIAVKSNMFINDAIESGGNYYFVFPCVKGIASRYGNPDIGTNNGYVVVGGEETFVGYCSGLDMSNDISNYTEMTGTRLDGQPQSDTHTYYMPSDVGWMCVGYDTAPVVTQNQDGSHTVTVNGVEVGCHLAMDNKKDDVAGESCANGINFGGNLGGILPSDSGPGACDEIVISGNSVTFTQRLEGISASDISWDCDGGTYDDGNNYYIWRIYGSIDGMKPDGAFAITGGHENSFISSYTDGNTICIMAPGDDGGPSDWPNDIDCSIVFELDEPVTQTAPQELGLSGDIKVSKYGVLVNINIEDDSICEQEYGVYTTVEYQQSGGDQIWNAIAYQREMAEVTAAALCDLDSRIGEVDFSGIQSQIDELEDNLEEVSEVTATALNHLNGEIEDINSDITEIWDALDEIPEWDENTRSSSILTFTAEENNCTIKLGKVGNPTSRTLQYSKNGGSWNAYTIGNELTLDNAGDYVKFRGSNTSGFSSSNYHYYNFIIYGRIAASGDVTSLMNNTGGDFTLAGNCFYGLFKNCNSLTTAPELPSTTLKSYCYNEMFYGCRSLVTAPALPATTMAQNCYSSMFYGCTSLVVAPELPATTLAQSCYNGMFYGCTSLTTAPALPATELGYGCYSNMFCGCTSLVIAPELPATTMTFGCYNGMFQTCTSLTQAQSILPATTLTQNCYSNMFRECTSLVTAPDLPATTLAQNCYGYMFFNCTSLVNAPELLPATTLEQSCYDSMFQNCTSLVESPFLPATTLATQCYNKMFNGCKKLNRITAMFTTSPSATYTQNWVSGVSARGVFIKSGDATWNVTGVNGVPTNWTKTTINPLTFTAGTGGSTIKLTSYGSPSTVIRLQYSTDGGTNWSNYVLNNTITLANVGDTVKIRGNNNGFSSSQNDYYSFVMTGTISASGDVTSLLNFGGGDVDLSGKDCCFYYMFYNCTSLTTAPTLPSTTLVRGCYSNMFNGCTSLTTAPTLPATTVAQFCYGGMFRGCTAMVSAPVLPATTLAESCYNAMFQNCTNLNYIKAMFTTYPGSNPYYTQNWVQGVSATGTFVKNSAATWTTTGVNGVPSGWTVQTASA